MYITCTYMYNKVAVQAILMACKSLCLTWGHWWAYSCACHYVYLKYCKRLNYWGRKLLSAYRIYVIHKLLCSTVQTSHNLNVTHVLYVCSKNMLYTNLLHTTNMWLIHTCTWTWGYLLLVYMQQSWVVTLGF